jgi:sodium-dependent dicarboxylate transporter 2/3/5
MATPSIVLKQPARSGVDVWRKRLGIPLTAITVLSILFMHTPAGLTPQGQKSIALLAGLVVLYLTEPVELTVASLSVVPAAVFLGLGNIKTALEGFATPGMFLMVGAIIMGSAMEKTRLAERFTYWLLASIGSSARNITFAVVLANIVLAFMIPSTTARTAILLPMCLSIISIYRKGEDLSTRSNFAVGLLLTLTFTNSTISAGILTASVPNPITVDFVQRVGGATITYFDWFKYGFPPALIVTFLTWWYIRKVFKPERETILGGAEHVRAELDKMGKVSGAEMRTLSVFILVVALWMTGSLTKIDATVACLVGVTLLFLPKFGVLKWKDTNRDSAYHILIINGGGLTAGELLLRTGAAKWLAVSVFGALGLVGKSSIVIVVVVMFICQFVRIGFMGTTGLAVIFMPVIVSLAAAAKMPAAALALPAGMIIAGFPLLMFYSTIPNLLVYGTGYLKMQDFPKVGFVLCLAAVIIFSLFAMTYWHWLGLF